jgi:hypothetical protein
MRLSGLQKGKQHNSTNFNQVNKSKLQTFLVKFNRYHNSQIKQTWNEREENPVCKTSTCAQPSQVDEE